MPAAAGASEPVEGAALPAALVPAPPAGRACDPVPETAAALGAGALAGASDEPPGTGSGIEASSRDVISSLGSRRAPAEAFVPGAGA